MNEIRYFWGGKAGESDEVKPGEGLSQALVMA